MATAAASTRPDTPSLDRMLPTWTPTVFWLMNRRSPISRFVRPAAMSRRTSRSRGLRPNDGGLRAGRADELAGEAGDRPHRSPPAAVSAERRRRPRRPAGHGHPSLDRAGAAPPSAASGIGISARPASSSSSRRSGRAPSSRASRTASSSGLPGRRPARRPSPAAERRLGLAPAGPGHLVRDRRAPPRSGPTHPRPAPRRDRRVGPGTRAPSRGRHRPRGATRSSGPRRPG